MKGLEVLRRIPTKRTTTRSSRSMPRAPKILPPVPKARVAKSARRPPSDPPPASLARTLPATCTSTHPEPQDASSATLWRPTRSPPHRGNQANPAPSMAVRPLPTDRSRAAAIPTSRKPRPRRPRHAGAGSQPRARARARFICACSPLPRLRPRSRVRARRTPRATASSTRTAPTRGGRILRARAQQRRARRLGRRRFELGRAALGALRACGSGAGAAA